MLQECENFRVKVQGVNSGGLLARVEGLQLFVPVSQLQRVDDNDWWSEEELRQQFEGTELVVSVHEIEPNRKKFVGSVTMAIENTAMRQIRVGALVWGTVRRVEAFGAFVGIDDTHVSGLIHISNVSRSRVRRVDEVFAVGDRVHALVMGIDEGYTNISLSTAELEVDDGDMLRTPQKVYDAAEEQQKFFLEHLAELRLAEEAYEAEEAAYALAAQEAAQLAETVAAALEVDHEMAAQEAEQLVAALEAASAPAPKGVDAEAGTKGEAEAVDEGQLAAV